MTKAAGSSDGAVTWSMLPNLPSGVTSPAEISPEDLASRARVEMEDEAIAHLLRRAMEVLRGVLADAGFTVGPAVVPPASLAAGLSGVTVRRVFGEISSASSNGAIQFQAGARLVADFRKTGGKTLTVGLQYEARDLSEVGFCGGAPVTGALNAHIRFVQAPNSILGQGLQALFVEGEGARLTGMAELFCVQLNNQVTP